MRCSLIDNSFNETFMSVNNSSYLYLIYTKALRAIYIYQKWGYSHKLHAISTIELER